MNKKQNLSVWIIYLLLIMTLFSSCHVGRFFYWNFADVNDYKKFPAYKIKKADEAFKFFEAKHQISFRIPDKFKNTDKEISFDQFLIKHKTIAFLIIRNDTIIFEKYFKGYSKESIMPSFSVSKAFVSALTGIAIEDGFIKNTDQKVTEFLPELSKNGFDKVSIENLLNMRTGLKFSEVYLNPFAETGKFYYGRNLKKYVRKLKVKEIPGEKYEYQSGNTQILAEIIEKTSSKKLPDYLQEKIWKPIGMEYDASWNYDSKRSGMIKAFCCLNARARDFAKFGRLYLNNGNWNGKQIVPADWIARSTSVINDSKDSQDYSYTYQWRVIGNGCFFAKGLLGQYIYVDPVKNLIFLRFGESYAKTDWADLFLSLTKQINSE